MQFNHCLQTSKNHNQILNMSLSQMIIFACDCSNYGNRIITEFVNITLAFFLNVRARCLKRNKASQCVRLCCSVWPPWTSVYHIFHYSRFCLLRVPVQTTILRL